MTTTLSRLYVADDEENQLTQLINGFNELKDTVEAQKVEINALKNQIEYQEPPTDPHSQNSTAENDNESQQEPDLGNQIENHSQNSTAESDNESLLSNNDKPHGPYYREPCSYLYISYVCRLLFTCTFFWDLSGALKWIASPFLFLSVVTSFSRRQEYISQEGILVKETETLYFIRIVGWLFNLGGAIVFFTVNPYSCYNCIDNLLAISLGLLAFGHLLELVHLLCLPKSPGYKAYIISLYCSIAGFLLKITLFIPGNFYIPGSILLIIHAIAQYVGIFYERPTPPGVSTHDDTVQQDSEPLPDDMLDSFTFMIVSDDIKVWHFGFLIFIIQSSLAIIILADQVVNNITGIPFDVPYEVPWYVTVAQGIGLFLCTFWQSDILASIHMLDMFWWRKKTDDNEREWPSNEIHARDSTFWTWLDKVLFPNALRFLGGLLVLATTFVIIVKSNNILDLFKDFTALILISQIDNIAFTLAAHCYFGKTLKDESDKVKRIRVNDNSDFNICGVPNRLFTVLVIFAGVFSAWAYFVYGQRSDMFYRLKLEHEYPNCNVDDLFYIGDGHCDGRDYNTEECGFDEGDCEEFYKLYPDCDVDYPTDIGDGRCDGGDHDTAECGFDEGDCDEFNSKYPDCNVSVPYYIGDGECDGPDYYTAECGFDEGDCDEFYSKYPDCNVDDPWRIGDGECWGGVYNTEECGFDGGDCIQFNSKYPGCDVGSPFWIGNGYCSGGDYNTKECGFDGGDCIQFNSKYPDCNVAYPSNIGNGYCSGRDYNTKECGFDGGDCDEFNYKYPYCYVDDPWRIGDGECDDYRNWWGGEYIGVYNTKECGFDGGDCL